MSKKRGLPLKASYPKSYVLYLKGSKKGPAIFWKPPCGLSLSRFRIGWDGFGAATCRIHGKTSGLGLRLSTIAFHAPFSFPCDSPEPHDTMNQMCV